MAEQEKMSWLEVSNAFVFDANEGDQTVALDDVRRFIGATKFGKTVLGLFRRGRLGETTVKYLFMMFQSVLIFDGAKAEIEHKPEPDLPEDIAAALHEEEIDITHVRRAFCESLGKDEFAVQGVREVERFGTKYIIDQTGIYVLKEGEMVRKGSLTFAITTKEDGEQAKFLGEYIEPQKLDHINVFLPY